MTESEQAQRDPNHRDSGDAVDATVDEACRRNRGELPERRSRNPGLPAFLLGIESKRACGGREAPAPDEQEKSHELCS
jgi:hypothetical protein